MIRNTTLTLTLAATLMAMTGAAHAATIYEEDFPNPATSGTDPVSIVGWTAYVDDGTDLTNTVNSLGVQANGYLFRSGGSIPNSSAFAAISDAGTIDPTLYQNDLTISFRHGDTLSTSSSPPMGYRVLVQVGSTIYASDFVNIGSATENFVVSDSVWHVWTGETDLTDGFDPANISGTAGNLAAGSLSNIGLLIIDGSSGADRQRVYEFDITGTEIPEPASVAMGLFGMTLIAVRRRR
jgi:hypothetical protein